MVLIYQSILSVSIDYIERIYQTHKQLNR